MTYILLIAAFIIFCTGEVFSKLYATNKTITNFSIAFICYLPAIATWLYLMGTKNNLTLMSVFWGAITTVTSVLIGLLVFKEHVTTYNIIGMALAGISFVLLWK